MLDDDASDRMLDARKDGVEDTGSIEICLPSGVR